MATVHQSIERSTLGCLSDCRTIRDMSMLEFVGFLLRLFRQFSVNILFHYQSSKRHTVVGSPSSVFHIHSHGNLWIVHRGKAHEYGVVVTTVLRRTGLTACHEVITSQGTACTTEHRGSHSLHHIVIGFLGGLGVVAAGVGGVEGFSLHLPNHVGHIVITAIGNRSTQVGYLQWGGIHLALTD